MREEEVCTLRRMLELSDSKIRELIKTAPKCYTLFLCECFWKVEKRNIPANKCFLKNHKEQIRIYFVWRNQPHRKKTNSYKKTWATEIYYSFVLSLLEMKKCKPNNLYYFPSDCLTPIKQRKVGYLITKYIENIEKKAAQLSLFQRQPITDTEKPAQERELLNPWETLTKLRKY